MKIRNFTEEQLREAVKECKSVRQIIKKLQITESGGNFYTIKKQIKLLNLDISHFESGCGWSKGKKFGYQYPIEDYYSGKRFIRSHALKLRLISEEIFPYECCKCKLTEWNNLPIPLELHHINGNHYDNSLENLTILCPNCHAQEPNNSGKSCGSAKQTTVCPECGNKCSYKAKKCQECHSKDFEQPVNPEQHCLDCGNHCTIKSIRCKKCSQIYKMKDKSKRPTKEQLIQDKEELCYFVQIGKKYGVSDNAVRKWFRFYGLEV